MKNTVYRGFSLLAGAHFFIAWALLYTCARPSAINSFEFAAGSATKMVTVQTRVFQLGFGATLSPGEYFTIVTLLFLLAVRCLWIGLRSEGKAVDTQEAIEDVD